MAMITGGEIVVRTLQEARVDTIFGIHGAHIDTIFQACRDLNVRIVDVRHEMAAGHAAEGYARVKRTLGVALVTAGGGFTNVVTSIANAFLDRTPVVFITGSGALRDTETNTLQAGIDQVALASPITKWAHRIVRPDQIARLVAQGIRIAQSSPRGPVLLDIPWDVLTAQVDETEVAIPAIGLTHGAGPHPADVAEALEILRNSQRPVLVVGSEASRSNIAGTLKEFVARTGIPVFADYEGLSLLSDLGGANAGLIQGLFGFDASGAAPDAILQLGVRFGLNTAHGSGALLPHAARIVQIDPDARELGRLQPIALGIVADVGSSLEALTLAASQVEWKHLDNWRQRVSSLVEARYQNLACRVTPGTPIHPFEASRIVAEHVDRSTVVIVDGALTYLWLSETMSQACPGAFLTHGFLGSMGVGFGTAIGAQLAAVPGSRTILVTGDGAVGYSLAEFDTLVRQKVPLIVIVMNNQSWGATLHFQQYVVGPNRITNTRLENGEYHKVAEAFGVDGYYAEELPAFEEALTAALASDRPACINVRVRLDPIPPEECLMIGKDPFPPL